MIDLSQYPKIQQDIQSNQTSLIPLVVIDPDSDNPIYISTIKGIFDGDIFWEDRGLNVSSIRESIDLESSKFKINNLSLSISNYEINGTRFSDFAAERGLLNIDVNVYYKTQSCNTLEDCMFIYKGGIKRFTHDDKSVKIQLEDKTEDKLSKEVPIANTGYSPNVYSEDYFNKPIPILYGRVDKAPAIPFLSESSTDYMSKILISCDDTVGGGILLGNFFSDDSTEAFLDEDTLNPLYIYKDDYFQVLETYNRDVVISDNMNDWTWYNPHQYNIKNGYLEVVKMYSGLTAQNPPADNEVQCIKTRFPNSFISLPNQSGGSDEGWLDSEGFSVVYEEPIIKSPNFAYDNPFFSESASSYYATSMQDYKTTFAQLPDNTIEIESNTEYIIQDFAAYRENVGIINNDVLDAEELRGQYEVMSWLTRYAHVENTLEDPRLQFIRMPCGKSIERRLNIKLWEAYATASNTVANVYGQYEDATDVMNYYIDNGMELPMLISGTPAINAVTNIDSNLCTSWATASGFDNTEWFSENYLDDKMFNNLNYQPTVEEIIDPLSGQTLGEFHSGNVDSFHYMYIDGTAQGRGDSIVNYPNFWMRYTLTNSNFNMQSTNFPAPDEVFGTQFASISLKNGNIATYNSSFHIGLYYNIIDLEDGDGGLYTADELATYTPIHLTYKSRIGSNSRSSIQKYTCGWNGVGLTNPDDGQGTSGSYGANDYYFGYYSAANWTSTSYKVREKHILAEGNGDNSGWFIWAKKDITDIGEGEVIEGEYNVSAPNLKIQANTLISMGSWHKTSAYHDSHFGGILFDTGTILNLDATQITINKTDSSSRRYGAIFPFKDQEISDDIQTSTYFSGKMRLDFDDGTTDTSTDSLKVSLGAVDVVSDNPETDITIDWETFDQGLDDTGATLIEQTLADCIINSTTYYDTFDTSVDATNNNANTHNYFTELLPINEVFHEISNYNSLGLFFRLDNETGINIPENVAHFNLNVYSMSMIHYVVFEAAFDSPLYINQEGRINSPEDISLDGNFKYTNETIDSEDDYSLIERPSDILYHFIEQELGLIDSMDLDSLKDARDNSNINNLAFSVNENIKARELIEKICKNTNLFGLFKGTSLFSLAAIKNIYNEEDAIIESKDIIKYSFTRTPVEKVHTIVNVKYKKDYEEDKFKEETGYMDAYDMFGNKDLGYENGYSYEYLGLEREDRVLEFESEVIRDRQSAESLRNFLLMYNCNQHNIFKLTIPLKYMYLEVGDIIRFDSLIRGIKVYGEDYTGNEIRNGQTIYPYFIINSIDKKQKNINIEATQLHNLNPTFDVQIGSVTRASREGQPFNHSAEDYNLLLDFTVGAAKYYTEGQKKASDINSDGFIDDHDVNGLHSLLNFNSFNGDVTGDGIVNVTDIVQIINQILGGDISDEILEQADVNQDGTIDILDVIILMNQIINV